MTDEQQLLPFDFVLEERQKEQEEKEKKEKQIREMINALPYYPEPKNDHQKLFNLQYEYRHGRTRALDEMYDLCFEVCMKIIKHICKHNPKIKISYIDKTTKARDAAGYFILQYAKRADFMRQTSILSYLFKRVYFEMFNVREVDKIVEFVDIDQFFKEKEDYGQPDDWIARKPPSSRNSDYYK